MLADIKNIVELISGIAAILTFLTGSWLAVFVFLQFAPVLSLRIISTWPDEESRWVIIRLEVENKSRVRVRKDEIHLQVLEHEIKEGGSLSEWVPFKKDDALDTEQPIDWRDPLEVFKSTKELADRTYHETVTQAAKGRQDELEKAWQIRNETIEQAWQIYSKIAR